MVYSGALGKLIREKTYSRKSRVRLPLTCVCLHQVTNMYRDNMAESFFLESELNVTDLPLFRYRTSHPPLNPAFFFATFCYVL
jgi:hypothetical protein